jgi:hypothetical protein
MCRAWLRRLVAGFIARRPGVAFWLVHVEFVVSKVALGQVYLRVILFPLSFILFMSVGCDYVSELRPPTGLLFILQVIYDHLETMDIYRDKSYNSGKKTPVLVPHCQLQIAHGPTRSRTWASAVRVRRSNARAMAGPGVVSRQGGNFTWSFRTWRSPQWT